MGQGTNGRIEVYEHFMSPTADSYLDVAQRIGTQGVMAVNIGAPVFAGVVDEPGGIQSITTDTTDNDNVALYIGPFVAGDGGVWMEARLKTDAITDNAVFVGFTEILDASTPVMPAEFATESFVYSSTGSIIGLQFDKDATTPDWRACATNDQSYSIDCDSLATAALNPPVADKFDVIRVEVDPDGNGEVWLGEDAGALKSVKRFTTNPIQTTVVLFATVMIENRADAAAVMEVDYFNAGGYIDWTQ